jgi:hypothetical protein
MMLYFAALICVALPLCVAARRPLDTVAGLIIANWLLGVGFNYTFGTYTPWLWSLLIDTTCAIAMINRRHGEMWPVAVAMPYVAMILCHFVYAHPDGNWPQHAYWSALTGIAWVQMGLLTLYGGSHLVSHFAAHPFRTAVGDHNNFNHESVEK